jgi:hypothetical protein
MSSARRMIVKPRSAGGGFRPRLVDKKMGIVYNPARSSSLTPAERTVFRLCARSGGGILGGANGSCGAASAPGGAGGRLRDQRQVREDCGRRLSELRASVAPGAKFCGECGQPIKREKFCSQCGTKIEGTSKFCPEGGAKM